MLNDFIRVRLPRVLRLVGVVCMSCGPTVSIADDVFTTQDCTLEPRMVVHLSSPVTGVIAHIDVDRGDAVKRGQTIVGLRASVEQSLVNLSRAEAGFGEVTAARNEELFEQDLISEQEKDEIAIKGEVARLQLAAAQARLLQRAIASPIDGVVVRRMMDPGEYVGEDPILEIASLDPLHVEAVLPSGIFGRIRIDTPAEIVIGEPLGTTHEASIVVIDQIVDGASGTFGVRLSLPNPGGAIPAGLRCSVRFTAVAAP